MVQYNFLLDESITWEVESFLGLLVLGTVTLGRKLLLLTELTQPARSELLTCLFCLLKNLAVNLYCELVLPH